TNQFRRNRRKIVDEIQRIFDLVGDARSQLTKRREFFRLHQPVLGGPQIFERLRQIACTRLHAFKKSDVLNRDGSLVGKRRNELNLFVREGLHLDTRQGENADGFSIPQHRYGKDRFKSAFFYRLRERVVGISSNIRDMDGAALEESATRCRTALYGNRQILDEFDKFCRKPIACCTDEDAGLFPRNRPLVRFAQLGSRFDQCLQDSMEVKGRTADDFQYFCGGGLLLQCIGQFGGARLNFIEQANVLDRDYRLVGKRFDQIDLV